MKKLKVAKTTEERLWDFVAEQTKILYQIATSEDLSVIAKRQAAAGLYKKLKNALTQLGAII